ncbi:MAG: quinone oxidoreductase [Pseudomonadota bacterium]
MGKCILMEQTGGPDVLQPAPLDLGAPGPGQVRLRIVASGVNFIDVYHRTGLYPAAMPFVPGVEAAGVVEDIGEGVSGVEIGSRVGYLGPGTYATHVNAPADRLIPLPDGLSFEDAAALLLKGLTAWMLLFEVRRSEPGDRALIWAPVGGVGSLLVPWARSLGMDVIAVTSTQEKADLALELGANHVVLHSADVAEEVATYTDGKGASVVFDSVGAASQSASLAALSPRGWWITYGNASGPAKPVAPAELSQRGSLVMTRPSLFHFIAARPDLIRGANAVFGACAAGTLHVHIAGTGPLEDAGAFQSGLENRTSRGAFVLLPAGA